MNSIENEEGVFIPYEFFSMEELTNSERIVLAIYKYFTEKGRYKCCSLTNQQIADRLGMGRRNVIKIKDHLDELGLIEVKGRSVYYVSKSEPQFTAKVNHSSPQSEPQFTAKVNHSSLINVKKEKKIKKEKKGFENNFEMLVDTLDPYYREDEKIKFIEDTYNEWITTINSIPYNELDIHSLKLQLRNMLMKEYGVPETRTPIKEELREDLF